MRSKLSGHFEYLQSGRATEKSDMYSFGVVLLELLSGKWPTDQSFVIKGLNVVGWVNTLMRENRLEEIVDTRCDYTCKESMEAVLQIILRCIASNPQERPTMNQVVQMLEAETMSPCSSDFYVSNSEWLDEFNPRHSIPILATNFSFPGYWP